MKSIFFVLFAIVSLVTAQAQASGYTPVPGSCSPGGMGPGLCSCDLLSTADGTSTVHSDNIECTALSCADFHDAEACGGLKSASCELTNPSYAGTCDQEVTYDPSAATALEACGGVQRELNTLLSSGRDYCMGTTIRGGWTLISAR
jgi:hypothetical protein